MTKPRPQYAPSSVYFLKLLVVTLVAILAMPYAQAQAAGAAYGKKPVAALKKTEADTAGFNITDAQSKQIKAVSDRLDTQIKAAFVGHEALADAMKADLEPFKTLKPDQDVSAEVAAFQKKYGDSYRDVLKSGGVDLNAYAAEFGKIFPKIAFVVVNGTEIVGHSRDGSPPLSQARGPGGGGSGGIPAPSPVTRTLTLSDYTRSSTRDCWGISFGSFNASESSFSADSFSTVTGYCNISGRFAYGKDALADMKLTIAARFNMTTRANAAGVLGSSSGFSVASLMIGPNYFHLLTGYIAPFLWIGGASDELTNQHVELSFDGPSRFTMNGYVRTISASILSPIGYGVGAARISNPVVVETLAPR